MSWTVDVPEAARLHLPPAMPRFTRELRQFWEDRGSPRMPPRPRDAHDALVDAKHNLFRYRLMTESGFAAQLP